MLLVITLLTSSCIILKDFFFVLLFNFIVITTQSGLLEISAKFSIRPPTRCLQCVLCLFTNPLSAVCSLSVHQPAVCRVFSICSPSRCLPCVLCPSTSPLSAVSSLSVHQPAVCRVFSSIPVHQPAALSAVCSLSVHQQAVCRVAPVCQPSDTAAVRAVLTLTQHLRRAAAGDVQPRGPLPPATAAAPCYLTPLATGQRGGGTVRLAYTRPVAVGGRLYSTGTGLR